MKNLQQTFIVLCSILMLFTQCKEEDAVNGEQAPSLPPTSSFIMDFNTFPDNGANNGRIQAEEYKNFGFAILNVGAWQTGLALHLALPAIAFKESFNHEAVYLKEEKKWQWSYDVQDGGHTYHVKLHGKINDEKVKWEMYVTKEGVYEDFLWFEGNSQFDKTGGDWKVYTDPEGDAHAALSIEWTDDQHGNKGIKYTSIDETDEGLGSYIHYGTMVSDDFDSFFEIYSKKDGYSVEIDYNQETKQGRVKSLNFFGSDSWFCWDTHLMNIDC